MEAAAQTFEQERPRLMGLAYRMLGRWSEAQDVVQDAALRWLAQTRQDIRNHKGFLTTLVTRLAIDRLRREKARRETYPGPWLPEPVVTPLEGADDQSALAQDLSVAMLLLFERLAPEERAAFILREALGAPYAEIAQTLEKSEGAVRQIVSRARERIKRPRSNAISDPQRHHELIARVALAVQAGDKAGLTVLLAPDAVLLTDGGGRRSAALRPIEGAPAIVSLLFGLRGFAEPPRSVQVITLNGAPAALTRNAQGEDSVIQFTLEAGLISTIYISRNPEKLRHLNIA